MDDEHQVKAISHIAMLSLKAVSFGVGDHALLYMLFIVVLFPNHVIAFAMF